MEKMSRLFVCMSLVCFMLGGVGVFSASAEEGILEGTPLEVSADMSVYSKYIWRGFMLDEDPVAQPGVYIGAYGFTASIWGSFDIDSDDALNSDEVDYAIDYTHDFEDFSVSLGHTYYDFPAADLASKEFYLGGGLNTVLSPTLTWFYDYGDEDSLVRFWPFADDKWQTDEKCQYAHQ